MLPSSSSSSSSSSLLSSLVCDRDVGMLLRDTHNVSKHKRAIARSERRYRNFKKKAEELISRLRSVEKYEVDEALNLESFMKDWLRNARVALNRLPQLITEITKENIASPIPCLRGSPYALFVGLPSLPEVRKEYERLNENGQLVLMVFFLVPEDAYLNNSDVAHLIHHRPSSDSQIRTESILPMLLTKEFIRSIRTNQWSIKYYMHYMIRYWLLLIRESRCKYKELGGFHVIRHETSNENPSFIGISNNKLKLLKTNTTLRDHLFPEMQDAEVVLLGNWRKKISRKGNDYIVVPEVSEDYIVVEMEFLNEAIQNMKRVRYLSLQGTGGILHLPESICNLRESLQVLDLRACNNLESLPKEMEELDRLICLDLSECYFLEHIPIQIKSLCNLKVLKGFIINAIYPHEQVIPKRRSRYNTCIKYVSPSPPPSPSPSPSQPCPFSELRCLENLEKLTIRTRRMNFPTKEDLHTLCQLTRLRKLGITWVQNPTSVAQLDEINLQGYPFPNKVEKLEIQRAPNQVASQLLELISKQEGSELRKIYITGGDLQELSPQKHHFANVEVVRLRYLRKFKMEWHPFKESFPRLVLLQVFKCPNITTFPRDYYGIWKA